jgi:hypothetical protein
LVWKDLGLNFKRYEFWKMEINFWKIWKSCSATGMASLCYWASDWALCRVGLKHAHGGPDRLWPIMLQRDLGIKTE